MNFEKSSPNRECSLNQALIKTPYHGVLGVLDDINKSIKATARSITKTKLSDKIQSTDVLKKANLKCLNEAVASITATTVWKSKKTMNPLGCCLFREKNCVKHTRFASSNEIRLPVPGYPHLATNTMARVWNNVSQLHTAETLGAAKAISNQWSKSLPAY